MTTTQYFLHKMSSLKSKWAHLARGYVLFRQADKNAKYSIKLQRKSRGCNLYLTPPIIIISPTTPSEDEPGRPAKFFFAAINSGSTDRGSYVTESR